MKKNLKKILLPVIVAFMLIVVVTGLYINNNSSASGLAKTSNEIAVTSADSTDIDGVQTTIALSNDDTEITGEGAVYKDGVVTISSAGTYTLSGTLDDGQINIDVQKGESVVLILNGVTITNLSDAAIYVTNAGSASIVLADGTTNVVSSGEETSTEDASGAAIYSCDDLTISGNGSLIVNGYINNGIQTKNNLVIESGTIEVNAVNNGIKGKDSVTISGGTFTITTGGDAIKSNDTTGDGYGVVTITGGTFTITADDDGIQAYNELNIEGGDITVTQSYEGLEANQINISGGTIDVTSSDDGLNANGGSGMNMGQESSTTSTKNTNTPNLTVSGGTLTVNAVGDGLDSNGNIYITGGTIIVNGPVGDMDGAIDSGSENGGECVISGGTILAAGSSGMAETFEDTSTQYSILYYFSETVSAGEAILITDSDGNTIYEYVAVKDTSCIVFSSPDLEEGETYTISSGDQSEEVTLDSISVTGGTAPTGGMGGGPQGQGGGKPGQMGQDSDSAPEGFGEMTESADSESSSN